MKRTIASIACFLVCVLAASAATNWTAYNDCVFPAGDASDVTSSFTTNNPLLFPSGSLITEAGQVLTNVTVSMTTNLSAMSISASILASNVAAWPVGTDAANEFQGKTGRGGLLELSGTSPQAVVTVTLAGLTASKQYKLVVWCSRVDDSASYSNRYTDVILSSADTFTNSSTVAEGVTPFVDAVAGDGVTLRATLRAGYGPVARYEKIRPGLDGSIVFRVRRNSGSAGNAYLSAFKLEESDTSFTNAVPATPTLLSPADLAVGVSLTPALTASAFSDADLADTHVNSQWQVSTDAGFVSTVWDSGTAAASFQATVPVALSYSTTYYWRVRYRDSAGDWSLYSVSRSFQTMAAPAIIAHYVDADSASPAAPYLTPATAARHIQDAVTVAAAGESVYVMPGVYTGGSPDGTSLIICSNNITIASTTGNPLDVRIDGSGMYRGVTLIGATLRGVTVSNCLAALFGGGVSATAGSLVDSCFIVRNHCTNYSGGGIYLSSSTARSCVVAFNMATRTNSTRSGGGIYARDSSVLYCTVVSNYAMDQASGISADVRGSNACVVEGCIVWGNYGNPTNLAFWSHLGALELSDAPVARFNCTPAFSAFVDRTEPPSNVVVQENMQLDPKFIPGTYRLSSVSPCINAGWNQPWMTGVADAAGNSRTTGAYVDMGAFEFQPADGEPCEQLPKHATWQYLDNGVDQGTGWRNSRVEWSSGTEPFGYGSNYLSQIATTNNWGPSSLSKYPTYYYRRDVVIGDLSTVAGGLTFYACFDDGAAVYINGALVFQTNMPADNAYAAFAPGVVGVATQCSFHVDATYFLRGINAIAVEVKQSDPTSTDLVMDLWTSGLPMTTNSASGDSDGDWMDDAWEILYFGGTNALNGGTSEDYDQDGLNNRDEYVHLTNPTHPDTDADGMRDAWEVANALDPRSASDTGLDADADGLTHFQEYMAGTNPRNSDSDSDGLPDKWELDHGLNPVANDAGGDLDGDGLLNGQEYTWGTRPDHPDTDGDGLTDYQEYVTSTYYRFTTNSGAINITGYSGPGGAVVIPDRINGFPVTVIAQPGFAYASSITDLTIPNSITSMNYHVFGQCNGLTNIMIGTGLVRIASSSYAFYYCTNLSSVHFLGNAPSNDSTIFYGAEKVVVYYRYGATGWGATFGGRPVVQWNLPPLDYTCTTNANTVTITRYSGPGGAVSILGATYGMPITRIGDFAFDHCANLTSITIPSNVTSIGMESFGYCTGLTNVALTNGLASIGSYAFAYCTSLAGITIPTSVTNIGNSAFYNCTSLTEVLFMGDAPAEDGTAFTGATNAIIYYRYGTQGWGATFGGRPTATFLPYRYITNNGTITITGYIGSGGSEIMLPSINGLSVTRIETNAFSACSNLTSIVIPDSVTYLGAGAFEFCTNLTSAVIGNGIVDIEDGVFQRCSALESITLGNNVRTVGNAAFDSCRNLASFPLPDGLIRIGDYAFLSCSPDSVTIPDSVTHLGVGAFDSCTNLTRAVIGSGIVDLEDYAFRYCTALTSLTMGANVTNIGDQAFGYCTNLTALTIPDKVTRIGNYAFYACSGLNDITLSSGLRDIGDRAFSFCVGLNHIAIPNGATNIGEAAFYGCTGLSTVSLPGTITRIGDYAFMGCSGLSGLYAQGNAPSTGLLPLNGASDATVYYLPGRTGWGPILDGRLTGIWSPEIPSSRSFGVQSNRVGFDISGASGMVVVVEGCSNIVDPVWSVVATNTLTDNTTYFSDPQWTNQPVRFYRLRMP